MLNVLIIRHGERTQTGKDEKTSLTEEGRKEVNHRGSLLRRLGLFPQVYLTSHYQHAKDSTSLLVEKVSGTPGPPVLTLCSLTPHSPTSSFEDIYDEAQAMQADLEHKEVIALVGHEPRLSHLVVRMTSKRHRPLAKVEIVCVEADDWNTFFKGAGEVKFRIPFADYQEEQLRAKIRSKTTVSTFVAGFTFTALLNVLLKDKPDLFPLCAHLFSSADPKTCISVISGIAIVSLTGALILFVASVYMYDCLSIPEGFWSDQEQFHGKIWRGKAFEEDVRKNGILYALMVWAWKWVFTPAVCLALLGFISILVGTGSAWITLLSIAALVVGFCYYQRYRPRLGID